jgi:hypothetical protein
MNLAPAALQLAKHSLLPALVKSKLVDRSVQAATHLELVVEKASMPKLVKHSVVVQVKTAESPEPTAV